MFEDSLVESEGRIRTRSKWLAGVSFAVQGAVVLLLILLPFVHPQALPKQSLERLLIAPLPPRAPAAVVVRRASAAPSPAQAESLQSTLRVPSRIPNRIDMRGDAAPPPASITDIGGGPGIPDGTFNATGSAPHIIVKPAGTKKPMPISSGVAAGQLLSPIRPLYPEIAKAARVEGAVMLQATISKTGTIENLRVIDGPPLLRQAAVTAVAAAHYRPFLLNGEPVEVETTIRVIFSLGG